MMDLTYENHEGKEIALYDYPIIIQSTNMFDYSWTTSSKNDRISGFKKGVTEFDFELLFHAKGDFASGHVADALSEFYEITEADIKAQKPGKLKYVTNTRTYCMEGYFRSSANTKWNQDVNTAVKNVVFVTDRPYWVCELDAIELVPEMQYNNEDEPEELNGRDYALNGESYGRGYINNTAIKYFDTSDYYYDYLYMTIREGLDLNFVIEIEPYDEMVENPRLILERWIEHDYAYDLSINCKIKQGEKLIITNIKNEQSITLIRENGKKVNMFDKRSRDKDIFSQILSSRQGLAYLAHFSRAKFTIKFVEYSSEPQWLL